MEIQRLLDVSSTSFTWNIFLYVVWNLALPYEGIAACTSYFALFFKLLIEPNSKYEHDTCRTTLFLNISSHLLGAKAWKSVQHICIPYLWCAKYLSNLKSALLHHAVRMHLVGHPSAPTILKGRQWTVYFPGLIPSRFRPSTRTISWRKSISLCSYN